MKKRGQIALKPVIEIVIGVSVVFFLIALGVGFGSHTSFQKARVARDGALMVNSLYTYPINSWVAYPYDVSDYSFDFWNNHVRVYKGEDDVIPGTYAYLKNQENKQLAIGWKENIYLSVDNGEFGVSETVPQLDKFQCEKSKINLRDREIEFDIEQAVSGAASFDVVVGQVDSELGSTAKISCIGCSRLIASDTEDIHIKLESVNDVNKFKVFYYYNSIESRDLACFILNKLLDKNPGAKVSLIPTDELSKPGLILKLGSFEGSGISSALVEGIKEYYAEVHYG